jgi:hypothetical protein
VFFPGVHLWFVIGFMGGKNLSRFGKIKDQTASRHKETAAGQLVINSSLYTLG